MVVEDQDSVKDMLKDGSELADGSIGSAIAGALLAPNEAKIQAEDEYAEGDADEQSGDEDSGVARDIDSGKERNEQQGRTKEQQEEGSETEP